MLLARFLDSRTKYIPYMLDSFSGSAVALQTFVRALPWQPNFEGNHD